MRLVQSIIAVPVAALLLTGCQDDSNDGPSPSRDGTASCLRQAGYQVEVENFLQRQLRVVTPSDTGASGRVGSSGIVLDGAQVTLANSASATLTFFESPDEAAKFSEALRDAPAPPALSTSAQTTLGSVLISWRIDPAPGEAETINGCIQRATPAG